MAGSSATSPIEPERITATPERSVQLTQVVEWDDGRVLPHSDSLAAEEPLEIRIGSGETSSPLSVTMRTPGHDEELAAGFLWTEGIVDDPAQIASLTAYVTSAAGKQNGIEATLKDCEFDPAQLQRNFFAASSCGICGKASIDAIRISASIRSCFARCRRSCARLSRFSAAREGCTRLDSSTGREIWWFCGKTLAATMRWTRWLGGRCCVGCFRFPNPSCW